MKTPDRVLDVDSNLRGERVEMSIETGSMGHIMGILTELYSDAEMAVLREYSTNGRDEHVKAGTDRPIEVTLPTDRAPNLTIRDYGQGLDADDIREIYSRYGASTKRDTDDAVGMLGLGCKSALAYTDQFTLAGVKDGACTVVSVARTEDGGGDMTIVSQYATDELSGVTVTVPVKRENKFREKAAALFRFWDEGTVLVDGEAPDRIGGLWVADDLLITSEAAHDCVVMGGVPYPTAEKHEQNEWSFHSRWGWKMVAFVGIGDVNFVPSREQLMFNAKTRAKVAQINARFAAERDPSIVRQVAEAETAEEALRIALLADQIMGSSYKNGTKSLDLRWRGQPVPTSYDFESGVIKLQGEKVRGRGDNDWYTSLPASDLRDGAFFVNYDGLAWSPNRRAKLELWLERTGVARPEHFVLMPFEMPADLKPWIGDASVHDWRVGPPLEKVRSERPKGTADGATGNAAGVYTVRDLAKGTAYGRTYQEDIDASAIDRGRPILYTFKNVESWGTIKEVREAPDKIAKHRDPDAQIVILGLNRASKFQREFPAAENLEAYNARTTKEWLASLTTDERAYLQISQSLGTGSFAGLDTDRIEDPALKEAVRIANLNRRDLIDTKATYGTTVPGEFKDPRAKYPLLSRAMGVDAKAREHFYIYVNAAYAAREEGSK